MLENTSVGSNAVADNTGWFVSSQSCEISRNSPKIRAYSSTRSSKVTDLNLNRKQIYATSYQSLLVTLYVHVYLLPFSRY